MLGLGVDLDFTVVVGHEQALRAVARIHNVGMINGMLIFYAYDDVQPYADELVRAGYGYAILDEPLINEEFDLDAYRDMFIDWGWQGSNEAHGA
jgi:hypothetical protein